MIKNTTYILGYWVLDNSINYYIINNHIKILSFLVNLNIYIIYLYDNYNIIELLKREINSNNIFYIKRDYWNKTLLQF